MSFIFISYSRKDQAYVSKLTKALQDRQLPFWIDDRIDYGTQWPRAIQENLEKCKVFILIMTPNSYDSHWVQCELSLALEMRKYIYPLLLNGSRWLSVAAIQTVDIKGGRLPPENFFKTVGKHFVGSRTGTIWQTVKPIIQAKLEDELTSEKGVDYTRLCDLLKAQNFEDGDYETYLRMLEVVGRKEGDWLRPEEALNFPCTDLKTIDRLWGKYSNGRFGFSVQKEVYVQCGAKLDGKYPGDKIYEEFSDRVGWRMNSSGCIPDLQSQADRSCPLR
ncbi:MAG: GUN4 domain-containing protein [Cyanobacteria bacterium J06642_2]